MKNYLVLVVMLIASTTQAAEAAMKGDALALTRVETLLETLGGRALWAEAKSLYSMEKARYPRYGDGIVTTVWYNLEAPGEWADIQHPNLNLKYAWTEAGGWVEREGKIRDFDAKEVASKTFHWRRDIFTLYHRLAAADSELILESIKPFGVRILDAQRHPLAEIQLTEDGEIYLYRQLGNEDSRTILFGPYKSFGKSRFPDWSSSADGNWSAYHVQLMPSRKPLDEQVSLKKPVQEWHGGAVRKDCAEPR